MNRLSIFVFLLTLWGVSLFASKYLWGRIYLAQYPLVIPLFVFLGISLWKAIHSDPLEHADDATKEAAAKIAEQMRRP